MDDGWMMDGWMAYSISPGWCVLDNGVLDVDGLYSTSSGLHSTPRNRDYIIVLVLDILLLDPVP
jgi:hypothetical protein